MTRISLALAATLLAGTAMAQGTATAPGNTAPVPGVSPDAGVTPGTGLVGRSGAAAASGDRNQAVATTGANAARPAHGSSSFTQAQARRRLERNGYEGVSALTKDSGGVWHGSATKDGQPVQVWLDYKGNTGQQGGMASSMGASGAASGRAVDPGTTPPGAHPTGNTAARSGITQ